MQKSIKTAKTLQKTFESANIRAQTAENNRTVPQPPRGENNHAGTRRM